MPFKNGGGHKKDLEILLCHILQQIPTTEGRVCETPCLQWSHPGSRAKSHKVFDVMPLECAYQPMKWVELQSRLKFVVRHTDKQIDRLTDKQYGPYQSIQGHKKVEDSIIWY